MFPFPLYPVLLSVQFSYNFMSLKLNIVFLILLFPVIQIVDFNFLSNHDIVFIILTFLERRIIISGKIERISCVKILIKLGDQSSISLNTIMTHIL